MEFDHEAYFKMVRRNRRIERIRNFLRSSRLVWVLDPRPYETHMLYRRSIAEGYNRDKVRNKYSWGSIARLQNEKAFKAGLAGIVTAPVLASLAISDPLVVDFTFPIQMAFIFASGLFFVIATAIYNFRVPVFVRKSLEPVQSGIFKPETIREMSSPILFEFLALGQEVEITLSNVHELAGHDMAFRTANLLLSEGGACFKAGFDVQGQALIEKLLYRLAEKHSFRIYEEYIREDGEFGLRERGGPVVCFPAGEIHIRHLKLERAKEHHVTVLNPERVSGDVGERDLVVKFYDPYIRTPDQIDKATQVDPYTHGLHNILLEEYAETIVDELSYWQSWQRPFSRLGAFWLYRASLLSFVVFLIFQTMVVWNAVIESI